MADKKKSKNKIIIYTAISNNYETLRNPDFIDPSIKYICFTDQPIWQSFINNTVWEIKKIPKSTLDSTRKARQIKILPHVFFENYNVDYSIWVDGNINITGDVNQLISNNPEETLLCFKHPFRDCTFLEMEACKEVKKDDPNTMQIQMDKYRKEGFPEHSGLIESNVLIRKHTDKNIINFMEAWWSEVKNHSKRDQLSFSYIAWKKDFDYFTMADDNARENSDFFRVRPGWRTTPTQSKFQIAWSKFIGWRCRQLFKK